VLSPVAARAEGSRWWVLGLCGGGGGVVVYPLGEGVVGVVGVLVGECGDEFGVEVGGGGVWGGLGEVESVGGCGGAEGDG